MAMSWRVVFHLINLVVRSGARTIPVKRSWILAFIVLVPNELRAVYALQETITLRYHILFDAHTHALVRSKISHHALQYVFTEGLDMQLPYLEPAVGLQTSPLGIVLIDVLIQRPL